MARSGEQRRPGTSHRDSEASALPIAVAASTSLGSCGPSTTREAATTLPKVSLWRRSGRRD